MGVIRVLKDKNNPYVVINKYYINDDRLSLKAKGLMSYFLSKPDDWEFYVTEIMRHTTDKETSITGAIKELIKTGYIKRDPKRSDGGKFLGGYDYTVFEVPIELANDEMIACTEFSPKPENPESGKSRTGEIPNRGNPILLNNEYILNKETTTNIAGSGKGNFEVFKHFEKCGFGLISPTLMEKIAADIEIYGKEWVVKAAEIADEQGKHNYSYVKGTLENWSRDGGMKTKKDKVEKVEKIEKQNAGAYRVI